MGSVKVKQWPNWYYLGRVNVIMCYVIVTFDMVDIYCLPNSWLLVKIKQVTLEIGIINYAPDVALEMSKINRVEPD